MKSHFTKTRLAAFVLAFLVILQSSSHRTVQAARLLLSKTRSTSSSNSSSQAFKDLHEKQQNLFKKAAEYSSVRQIPPSRSNPTQNKYKPPKG